MFWRRKPKIIVLILTLTLVIIITFVLRQQQLILIDCVKSANGIDFTKSIFRCLWGTNVSCCAQSKNDINLDEIKRVTIAMAICDKNLEEGITAVKSMIVFSTKVILDLRIFYDNITYAELQIQLPVLQKHSQRFNVTLEYHLYRSTYPTSDGEPQWNKLYKACAAQRLFYASLLTDVDAVIHVDTDVVFLSDVRELWQFFLQMNSSQLAGMTHHDEPNGWGAYSHAPPDILIPYYGPRGVQDGIMLQNLTRLRAVDFQSYIAPIYTKYRVRIIGDQCVLNIYFHFHPDQMFLFPCTYNYIVTHCDRSFNRGECLLAKETGITVLHGAGMRFDAKNVGVLFRNLYQAFLDTDLKNDTVHTVTNKLYRGFYTITPNTMCSNATVNILQKVKKYL